MPNLESIDFRTAREIGNSINFGPGRGNFRLDLLILGLRPARMPPDEHRVP